MANTQQKSNDPAQHTLAAIEDALRMREGETPVRAVPQADPDRRRDPAADLFQDDDAASPPWAEDGPVRPANDDRQAIGKILQALQRRPSRTPYLIATTFSVLWVIGGAVPDCRGR